MTFKCKTMIKKIIFKTKMRWKYKQCHKFARLIASMGQENLGQKYLDDAKDSLYQAAIVFKNESKS